MVRAAGQGHGRNDAATRSPGRVSQALALGLWGPKLQILGVRLGPGSRLGLGRPGAWAHKGLGPWGLGPGSQSGSQKFFVALKSLLLGAGEGVGVS